MKNRKKLLFTGACIALALLLVGVALYYISWPTDVEIDNWHMTKSDGFDVAGVHMKLTLRRHNYIFRPAEYEILEFDALDRDDGFTLSLPEGCRAVSQHTDPSYVITQGFFKGNMANEPNDCYFAFSIENGLFILNYPKTSFYLVGYTDQYHRPIQVADYFSDFIDNGCEPPLSTESAININGTETTLRIWNWAVVSADGEVIEEPDMKLNLRIRDYLSENPEFEVLSFDQPQENRYAYTMPNGNPMVHRNYYVIIWGAYWDRYLNKDYTSYYALNIKDGLFIAQYLDTEYYLIGFADKNYNPKDILKHFSGFIDSGCQPW